MSTLIEQAPHFIRAIAPYKVGKPISEVARELGLNPETIVKLASNENPLGPGELAKQAIIEASKDLGRYPDANGFDFKNTLSEKLSIQFDQITLGNGSNDVLELVAKAFLTHGTNAVFSQYAFAVYPLATQACGAESKVVPAVNHAHDLKAFLRAINANTRVVFIANPNNPTGTFINPTELKQFLEQAPTNVLIVLDEAYTEYLTPDQQYNAIEWIKQHPNLLVTRSFSKAHGLAGLRVGYGVSSVEVANLLNRVRQPFNVNAIALAAANASLSDVDFLQKTYQLNQKGLEQLQTALQTNGLEFISSSGNFVLFKAGEHEEAGLQLFQALQEQAVIVRPVAAYGLGQWVRVSVGLEAENEQFINALPAALKKVQI